MLEGWRRHAWFGKCRPQRCRVRAHGIIRHERPGHFFRGGWLHAHVHMLAVVAVRPAIETTVLHRGDVVGHQVAADLVTLVDGRPQGAVAWLPGQPVGVAQAGGEQPVLAAGRVHFPDRRAALLLVQAVFSHVAVGADGHEELLAIRAGDHVLGPVVVEGATG
ncbi:hypothetical protein D3C76_1237200 [compost metagenome]